MSDPHRWPTVACRLSWKRLTHCHTQPPITPLCKILKFLVLYIWRYSHGFSRVFTQYLQTKNTTVTILHRRNLLLHLWVVFNEPRDSGTKGRERKKSTAKNILKNELTRELISTWATSFSPNKDLSPMVTFTWHASKHTVPHFILQNFQQQRCRMFDTLQLSTVCTRYRLKQSLFYFLANAVDIIMVHLVVKQHHHSHLHREDG